MIERYPAPQATEIFSDPNKINLWRQYTDRYALELIRQEKPKDRDLARALLAAPTPSAMAVKIREQETGHDFVAFLSMYTQRMPPEVAKYIHRGLTSSDIVDAAHFRMLRRHADALAAQVTRLCIELERWTPVDTKRAGRTHGQLAAPTSWSHRMLVNRDVLLRIRAGLAAYSLRPILKSPGPTGVGSTAESRIDSKEFKGFDVVRSTQIIPRDYQLEWACLYLRLAGVLENLALQVRLGSRTEVQEVTEGAARNRVGSSSMPHKRNPITSEKVCGLARVARGHFAALAENVAFWEDRDLTNSSVERLAVPDLAATVEHMADAMIKVLNDLEVATVGWASRAEAWTALAQDLLQKHADLGPVEASDVLRSIDVRNRHVSFLTQVVWHWLQTNQSPTAAQAWYDEFNERYRAIVG